MNYQNTSHNIITKNKLGNPDTFCILPFIHLSTTVDGQIRLCCRSKAISNIQEESLLEVWNGSKLKNIREDLKNGVRVKECQNCWKMEDNQIVSLRQSQNIGKIKHYNANQNKKNNDIKILELKLSNLCNFKCRMCSPVASTPWLSEWDSIKQFYNEQDRNWHDKIVQENPTIINKFAKNKKFLKDFEQIKDGIFELEFSGGEPLLDPLHYQILDSVIDRSKEITLKYSTNLSILGTSKYNIQDYWPKFKEVNLTISIDGFPELHEYIRTGASSQELKRNIEEVRPYTDIKGSTCISAYNAPFLAETANYICNDLKVRWYSNRLQWPDFLSLSSVPKKYLQNSIDKLDVELKNLNKDFDHSLKTNNPDFWEKNFFIQINRQLNDAKKWLQTKIEPTTITQFISYTDILDEQRGTSFWDFVDKNDYINI